MTVVLCALASGAGFYLSTGLGSVWALAWLAPIPVLWLAFKPVNGWTAFFAALAASIIGGLNLLPAYYAVLPIPVLAIAILGPALVFALSVTGARFVATRLSAVSGVFAFAALWTAFDYLTSLGPDGAVLSPALSQVAVPYLIQGASAFGLWVVTFLIAFFAAAMAAAIATKQPLPAIIAIVLVAVNTGYGAWRITTAPKSPVVHVGLAADDSLIGLRFKDDEKNALKVADAYAKAARTLSSQGAALIVFPERTSVLAAGWRGAVKAEFETVAHIGHATIVMGFDDRDVQRQNVAQVFFSTGAPPLAYAKRRLVAGLERVFVPGRTSFMLADRTAVAICKDMDYPAMLRRDAMLSPTVFAAPAWDFGADGWAHARGAVMRGVENGFGVARAANDGLLTVSDAYGRLLAEKRSDPSGMVLVQADLPRGPGHTLYARVGDALAWLCCALSLLLLGVAFAASRRGGAITAP